MTRTRLIVASLIVSGLVALPVVTALAVQRSNEEMSDLALLDGVIGLVQREYVHPVSSGELTEDALKGMLTRLDPHSDYMDEQEYRQSEEDTAGKFGGLGMEISEQDGVPKIVSPIDGTPAAQAKLQPGDLIVQVDHSSVQGMGLPKVVSLLRGDPGSAVTLTILRGKGAPFDATLTRQIIQVKSVKSTLESDGIGYVRISQFGGDTGTSFRQAINTFKDNQNGHIKGLVIDLRNDPGGLLSAAVDVAGDLLDGGTVVSIRGRKTDEERTFKAPADGDMLAGIPVAVLINGASASASEIVAGALQDRHRATVMGTQSFGKGSVQTIIPLKGHGAVRLTTALYFTPSGRSIQDDGISPDQVVEAPKDQQISGGMMMRESTLRGAFKNPGAPDQSEKMKPPAVRSETYSPPIKADLIGAPEDSQLKAALAYLEGQTKTAGQSR